MKKYTQETTNRTLTFYKQDLDTLQEHANFKNSVTDMIQEAIKDYITKQGWDQAPIVETRKEDQS